MGSALVAALSSAGVTVTQLTEADSVDGHPDAVVLAVPDRHIAATAKRIPHTLLVGHLSGATGLDVFGEREGFSVHPLTTIAEKTTTRMQDTLPSHTQRTQVDHQNTVQPASPFTGVWAAIDGTSEAALAVADQLATQLNMHPFRVAPADRAAYHAAASVASNFLITIENFAEQLAHSAGVPRAALVPLVEAAVANWSRIGPAGALTGPVARGDTSTVAAQREIVSQRTPEFLHLFDALVTATEHLARGAHS